MDDLKNSGKKNWVQGLNVMAEVSSWIIGPIVLALIAGNYLDHKYNTKPWLVIASLAVGFIITNIGLIRTALKYQKEEKQSKKEE